MDADERRCSAMSKRSGKRCRRFPVPGAKVCHIHGGGSKAVRAAAARRLAEAEAAALLELIWDPDAAPVTNAVVALQALAGRLQHAANVLGARLDVAALDGPTGLAWARVLRELRLALEGMERLDLSSRVIELEEQQAKLVTAAFKFALSELNLAQVDYARAVALFLRELRETVDQGETAEGGPASGEVVRGELQ